MSENRFIQMNTALLDSPDKMDVIQLMIASWPLKP